MDLSSYVPRQKHDLETAEAAVKLGYAALKPVMPQILEWHQDYNWPVAHVLNDLYRDADSDIIPHLEKIIRSDDWCWKYWIILQIIPQASTEVTKHFIPELIRLSRAPTKEECYHEINGVAEIALQSIQNESRG